MKSKKIKYLLAGLIFMHHLAFANGIKKENSRIEHPVFQVDYPFPTADKPQSKLWYMEDCWWAIIPRLNGPSLWQRTNSGWIEHPEINKQLNGVPGRADVYVKNNKITAVGVDEKNLVVFRIERNKNSWKVEKPATLLPPGKEHDIETATITADSKGNYHVAAVDGDKVCVWTSTNGGKKWGAPNILASGIGKDDICAISTIQEGVIVIWSDQLNQAVKSRVHRNGRPLDKWEKQVVIEQGNKTADDHLNTALSEDGTLWAATKNSVDMVGGPQFVLRVRSPKGSWSNYPYCNLGSVEHPSRPIILSVENQPSLLLDGYTIYNSENRSLSKIVFGIIDTTNENILKKETTVIAPYHKETDGTRFVNNVTGSKAPLPENAPWIVLASDNEGNVFEADLSMYFNK